MPLTDEGRAELAWIKAAKRRAIVRLKNGKSATLLSWGTPRHGRNGGTTNRVRLESQDGRRRWTAKKSDVVEILHVPGEDQ